MTARSDFDLDLRFGLQGERSVAKLLSIETVEVKTNRLWYRTGNLYLEVECWSTKTESWQPSGLAVTKATHWAFNMENAVLIVPTHVLKDLVAKRHSLHNNHIKPNPTRGHLVTVGEVLMHIQIQVAAEKAREREQNR